MLCRVLGIERDISFAGNDGENVSGQRVYFGYHNSNTDGIATGYIFIRKDSNISTEPLEVNQEYEFFYEVNPRTGKSKLVKIAFSDDERM